jgi:hypothetical protein
VGSLGPLSLLFAAWLGPALCVALAARRATRVSGLAAPARAEISARMAGALSESARQELRQELKEQRRDAERALTLAALWPHSLARVSLATGTAMAVAILAHQGDVLAARLVGAMVSFVGGFAGMAGCAIFGQQAKGAAGRVRQSWREATETAARE